MRAATSARRHSGATRALRRYTRRDPGAHGAAAQAVLRVRRHWLAGAGRRRSRHRDPRPGRAPIELVVIHAISLPAGEYGGPYVDALFTGTLDPTAHPSFADLAGVRVSAHLLIDRHGAITQYVPFHLRAWHAGASQWRGRPRCNDFSIGIELEGSDAEPFTAVQYAQLARVVVALRRRYRTLAADALAGHADIAPGRKTDPGPHFDWPRLRALLAAEPR